MYAYSASPPEKNMKIEEAIVDEELAEDKPVLERKYTVTTPRALLESLNCNTSKSPTTLARSGHERYQNRAVHFPTLLKVESENTDARTHIQRTVFLNALLNGGV